MTTKLYWVKGPWPGKLAISSRPRGGDWLADEVAGWKAAGVDEIVSLLTPDEELELGLREEATQAHAHGMDFLGLPVEDRQVPQSETLLRSVLEKMDETLSAGKNVVAHCRQGVGRAGLLAACLLINKGWEPEAAVSLLSDVRGTPIPETPEQRRWIDHYAAALHAESKP